MKKIKCNCGEEFIYNGIPQETTICPSCMQIVQIPKTFKQKVKGVINDLKESGRKSKEQRLKDIDLEIALAKKEAELAAIKAKLNPKTESKDEKKLFGMW